MRDVLRLVGERMTVANVGWALFAVGLAALYLAFGLGGLPSDIAIALTVAGVLLLVAGPVTYMVARSLARRSPGNLHRLRDKPLRQRYEIGQELGRGMNAVTFAARDLQDEEKAICIKLLLTPGDDARITRDSYRRHQERFAQEMKSLQELQACKCPFIVEAYDFCHDHILPFFTMRLCGKSLERHLKESPRPLALEDMLGVLKDVLQGLAVMHAHGDGIIHRDLKPANILYDTDHWVVSDLGMSLLEGARSRITWDQSLPGTIPYTAPEVMYLRAENVTRAADMFSLGITIKQMFTGSTDWEASIMDSADVKTADSYIQDAAEAFDGLVRKMTALHPANRTICDVWELANEISNLVRELNSKRGGREQLPAFDASFRKLLARPAK